MTTFLPRKPNTPQQPTTTTKNQIDAHNNNDTMTPTNHEAHTNQKVQTGWQQRCQIHCRLRGTKNSKTYYKRKRPPVAGNNSTNYANNPQASGANSTKGTSSGAARTNSTNDANDPKASGANSTNGTIIITTMLMLKRRMMHRPTHNKQPSPKELLTVTKATISNQILNMQTMMHPVKKMMRM
jgi:hypothetical protein